MSFKTILVHMANDERHAARLHVATDLARRFGAFLDILYVTTPVSAPAGAIGRAGSYAYLAEQTLIAVEKAERIQAEVSRAAAGIPHSWTMAEGNHIHLLAERAVYADLVIVTQAHPQYLDDRVPLHAPDELPFQVACPVLVIPWHDEAGRTVAKHAVIAWRPCREAALAVRDALPFLKQADTVMVLTVTPAGDEPVEVRDIMTYLHRHGIEAVHRDAVDDDRNAGDKIVKVAEESRSDLIVMGAYGHSRWREWLTGGSTRTVLTEMKTPVLISH